LAHQDREVLVLRYLENRDIPKIAELLGCRRAAVDARLSRARKRLRAVLGGTDDATSDGASGPGGGA
jgi:RNA polymerase sigma factor (sigma-70 family)